MWVGVGVGMFVCDRVPHLILSLSRVKQICSNVLCVYACVHVFVCVCDEAQHLVTRKERQKRM